MTFPGESVGLYDASDVTSGDDRSLADDVTLRAGSRTLAAGSSWRAWVDWGVTWSLGDGDDAVVSWVLEVTSGSGTVTASEGTDGAYGSAGASTPTGLGAHSVTGPATLVIPSGFTVSDVLHGPGGVNAAMVLRLDATAGSMVVQQVKLRVWPPGGALGAWSAGTYQEDAGALLPTYLTVGGGAAGGGTVYDNQPEFRSALAATVTGTPTVTGGDQLASGGMSADYDPVSGTTASGGWGVGYIKRPTPFYGGPSTLTYGTEWVYPPNEVPDDDIAVLFDGYDTASESMVWQQPVATLVLNATSADTDGNQYPVDGPFYVGADPATAVTSAGVPFSTYVPGTVAGSGSQPAGPLTPPADVSYVDVVMPEMSSDYLRVTVWHAGHFTDIAEVGGSTAVLYRGHTTDQATVDRLRLLWTPAPHRYWDPSGAVDVRPRVRQLHRDDGRGMTPPRHFGGASRATTGRHFGYD